jgi:hypothetical protein
MQGKWWGINFNYVAAKNVIADSIWRRLAAGIQYISVLEQKD